MCIINTIQISLSPQIGYKISFNSLGGGDLVLKHQPISCAPEIPEQAQRGCKLTRTLNCSILFFPDHCLIQNLSTKRIIGQGREFGGLYILETEVPKSVVCSGVVTPFDLHCCLSHPSLSLLKKLYPQFSSLSSLNCELVQYAKLH